MTVPDQLARAREFARNAGLGDPPPENWVPLTGGVSSDLWKVKLVDRVICVKGALDKLRVDDDWYAPVSRNAVEFEWFVFAARACPDNVPQMLAHDEHAGFFAMTFLDADSHAVWKSQLMAGDVQRATAAKVGEVLGLLHHASTEDPQLRATFATDDNFKHLRLSPYFETTARRNPGVAEHLLQLAARTAATHLAVVHGDFSPKNILIGPDQPVILDAECAWFGDPAFDIAFCLSHLCLKTLVRADRRAELFDSVHALTAAYARHISWEEPATLFERVATLLPALLLARIDGSSPVEYLKAPELQGAVRKTATKLLTQRVTNLADVLAEIESEWWWEEQTASAPSGTNNSEFSAS